MVIAFVFITADTNYVESILNDLKNITSVKQAYMVYGIYDIIAKIKADTLNEIREVVTRQIRRLDKVKSTQLMIVHEPHRRVLTLEMVAGRSRVSGHE